MTRMIIGAGALYILFFLMCFMGTGDVKKNMRSYYSYPDAVQKRIKESEELREMIPQQKSVIAVGFSNVILFTFVFTILGLILKLHSFSTALIYFLIVGEGLNIFDLLIIDMCWWRNTARTKFKEIPDKVLYRDMKKHFASFLRGIPVFVLCAILSAGILSIFH